MSFGQDFLQGFFGNDYLKDYTHASKIFRSAGYDLAPRTKFLYHVYFNLNTAKIPKLAAAFPTSDRNTLGVLVKNIQLPQYEIETDVLNQYNRKRIIQKKINYKPIKVSMHDDGLDLARRLWYNYYSYYYKDPSQSYSSTSSASTASSNPGNYNDRDIYNINRRNNDWGFIGESFTDGASGKPAFFKDITIYGFNNRKFASYTLINPMISSFEHDTYDYKEGNGVMENSMTIQYETVKYASGAIGKIPSDVIPGFGDPAHYDTSPSPLTRPGATGSLGGPGGLLATGSGLLNDLESAANGNWSGILGAAQKAGALANQVKNLPAILKSEASSVVSGVLNTVSNSQSGKSGITTNVPANSNTAVKVGSTLTV